MEPHKAKHKLKSYHRKQTLERGEAQQKSRKNWKCTSATELGGAWVGSMKH